MGNFTIYKHVSMGTPVYESETGPNTGYDNVQTNFFVVSETAEASGLSMDDLCDPESTRSLDAVIRDVSREELLILHARIDAALDQATP